MLRRMEGYTPADLVAKSIPENVALIVSANEATPELILDTAALSIDVLESAALVINKGVTCIREEESLMIVLL
jgi:hypothetical protein